MNRDDQYPSRSAQESGRSETLSGEASGLHSDEEMSFGDQTEPESESAGDVEESADRAIPDLDNKSEEELENLVLEQHKRILDLEERVEELREGQLRKAAELENMRKRTQRERVQMVEKAKADAIEQFLPVNDDLRRTLKALGEEDLDEQTEQMLEGVRMVAGKFEDVLSRYNVERIDQTGVPFNVDLHDALMRKKVDDESVESDTVLEVLENGYKVGDRTIRFAKVIVSE